VRIAPSQVPASWLVEPLASLELDEAVRTELRHLGVSEATGQTLAQRLAASFRVEWLELTQAATPGDAVWYFRSPQQTWAELAGRAGFALVRDGVPVAALVTQLS
jgi:hypothetical protein